MMSAQLPWIVIIDDDVDDITLLNGALEQFCEPCVVQAFRNPLDAIEFLTNSNNELPLHVFIDINMPVLQGDECLEILRRSKRLDDVSITMMSTSMPPASAQTLLSRGANFAVMKPTSFKEYANILRQVLHPSVICDSK